MRKRVLSNAYPKHMPRILEANGDQGQENLYYLCEWDDGEKNSQKTRHILSFDKLYSLYGVQIVENILKIPKVEEKEIGVSMLVRYYDVHYEDTKKIRLLASKKLLKETKETTSNQHAQHVKIPLIDCDLKTRLRFVNLTSQVWIRDSTIKRAKQSQARFEKLGTWTSAKDTMKMQRWIKKHPHFHKILSEERFSK